MKLEDVANSDDDSYHVVMLEWQRPMTAAILMFQGLVNLNDTPEEIENSNIVKRGRGIIDKINSLGDEDILELTFNELAMLYGAAQLTARLIHTPFATGYIRMTIGPANEGKLEEWRESFLYLCRHYIDFCNENYGDEPDFKAIRKYVEKQVK